MTAKRLTFLSFSLAIALVAYGRLGNAAVPSDSPLAYLKAIPPVIQCSDLVRASIAMPPDAPTHIEKAVEVTDAGPAAYCDVTGYVEPEVRFEVRLPLKNWTQRFVQTGCGGLCGKLTIRLANDSNCTPAQNGQLVLASTDMGHEGGMDAGWADGHPQRVIDFAYRGVHVTALAAKAITKAYYGQAPRYAYFAGCSDGGREALMEAQRFPEDFDGITAGASAMNFIAQNTFYHAWNAIVNRDDTGTPVLTAAQLRILHNAVIQACDASDGLKDGLISNPTACHFDPATIVCKPGQDSSTCLTRAQADVAAQLYQGAHDSHGQQMVISGPQYGSELAWAGVFVPRNANDHSMSGAISLETLRYLTSWVPKPNFTLSNLSFTAAEFEKITALHGLFDATDPDLSRFAGLNHRLIMWHGWADPHISPLNSIAYYEAMQSALGTDRVRQFARLYLFPGGYHCGGGEGPFNMDLLTPIMQWVERGRAPEQIVASHTSGSPEARNPGEVDRTRPVFPYPEIARYSGQGSINSASSFTSAIADELSGSRSQWLGSSFYQPGYELWCTVTGNTPKCAKRTGTQE